MGKYSFTKEQRTLLEGIQVPFAIYQYLNGKIETLVLSEGFCEISGYRDLAEAYEERNRERHPEIHPDDLSRVEEAFSRFVMDGGRYDVIYRKRGKHCKDYPFNHRAE